MTEQELNSVDWAFNTNLKSNPVFRGKNKEKIFLNVIFCYINTVVQRLTLPVI